MSRRSAINSRFANASPIEFRCTPAPWDQAPWCLFSDSVLQRNISSNRDICFSDVRCNPIISSIEPFMNDNQFNELVRWYPHQRDNELVYDNLEGREAA